MTEKEILTLIDEHIAALKDIKSRAPSDRMIDMTIGGIGALEVLKEFIHESKKNV